MLFCFDFLKKAWLSEGIKEKISHLCFKIASYLTDPICKAHEYFRILSLKQTLFLKKSVFALTLLSNTSLSLFTTLPGVAFRAYAINLQPKPYLYAKSAHAEKSLPKDGSFTLLSWNICCIAGGFSISDGGVTPWRERIEPITKKIIEKDADVNCLYEVFDLHSAFYLTDKLSQAGYTHIYYNIGPRGVGVSSGIFIASKYEIDNLEFTEFSKELLVGSTKNANKGFVTFDLTSDQKPFARVFATHLQHSDQPAYPTKEEIEARHGQMELIMQKIHQRENICTILTGDLNLDDDEYESSFWKQDFQRKETKKTWGGDHYCATLSGKKVSPSLNLDYLLVTNGSAKSFSTQIVETGFDPKIYTSLALSDHRGLLGTIKVHK